MTLRVVLACAAVLASGCKKKQSADGAPPPPAPPASHAPGAPAPPPPAPPGDRCRAAIDHLLALGAVPNQIASDKPAYERLASVLAEACRTDRWSGEQIACFERASDATSLGRCELTALQQERLRARMASVTGTDAGVPLGAAPATPAPSAREARLHGHAKLLAIDVSLFQLFESYPGAPPGTTFETGRYLWPRRAWLSLEAMQQELDAIRAASAADPSLAADPAIHAYVEKAAAWMPRLIALVAYYDGKKFVDDEFDRGRSEADDVRRTAAELARLRGPMRAAVLGAWRDLVAPYRDSPRAFAAHAWMACMSIADRVMEKARPEAITKAVSECRRSIPRLAGGASTSGFDADVRGAAGELGDWVAQGYPSWRTNVSYRLGQLTLRYVELWPRLPTTAAEQPAP